MEEKSNYLFVYGTLLDEQNEFAIYLKQNCTFYAEGKLKGRLYDLGEYPGAVLDNSKGNFIHGNIFILKNPNIILKRLDEYEGFGDDQENPNLFVRLMVDVEKDGEFLACWAYLYNLPVRAANLIKSGDYKKYKEDK